MDSHVATKQTESWTDEKHVRFLNNMEASFVFTMLADNGRLLPLDRRLPDSSDSTLDLKTLRQKKHTTTSVDFMGTTTRRRVSARPDKRRRRLPSRPYDSSQDQVVPHFESRSSDKDERDPPNDNVPVAAMAPVNR